MRAPEMNMKKRLLGLGAVARPDLLDAETVAQIADRAEAAHVDQLAAFAGMRLHQIGGERHPARVKITLRDHRRITQRPALPGAPGAPTSTAPAPPLLRRPAGRARRSSGSIRFKA